MKYALVLCLVLVGFGFWAPTANGQCNCSQPRSVTRYCIELGCYSRIVIQTCGGGDSCLNCEPFAYEVPCCEFNTVFSAAVTAPCNIITTRLIGQPGRVVRGFGVSCDGTLAPRLIRFPTK
jgi:hypothetical protein